MVSLSDKLAAIEESEKKTAAEKKENTGVKLNVTQQEPKQEPDKDDKSEPKQEPDKDDKPEPTQEPKTENNESED